MHHDILRSKNRFLAGVLDWPLIDDTNPGLGLGPDVALIFSASYRALTCPCPGSPGRIPGLKGVTNFFAGTLRIGVSDMHRRKTQTGKHYLRQRTSPEPQP